MKENYLTDSVDVSAIDTCTICIPVEIRFADMDGNGHMFFGNYFTLFDTAFLKYLKIIGYSFSRFLSNDLNFYYVEAKSQFKAPVKFDDEVCVEVRVGSVGNTSFTIAFEAINKTSNRTAALGQIVAVVVDLKSEKPSPLPHQFLGAIGYAEK
jgi:acyl-CoA thioester hydrolase